MSRASGASQKKRKRWAVLPVLMLAAALFVTSCSGAGTSGPPASLASTAPTTPAGPPPGTRGWQITHLGPQHAIEGFANRTSALPGEKVQLFVSTTAQHFTVTAYRIGDYAGSKARQVWKSGPLPGVRQADAVVQQPTNTVVAPWKPSLTVDTTGWRPGDYLFRLDGENGAQRYVPLTVRTKSNAGRIVIVNAVTTWQAYNKWGGYSLYDSPSGKKALRSRAVSFDRPYQEDTMKGAGDFLYFEMPFVLFAERSGRKLGYATDVDLDANPHLLDGAAAVVTLGHDEYWSANMRNNAVRARDHGVNLAFLGGNEIYRHMRFGSTPLGTRRLEIDYKSFSEDPASETDPMNATQEWRDPPNPRPESVILGNFYRCNPVSGNLVVADADNWLLKGIVKPGEQLPGMVGNEYSGIDLDVPTPRPIESLFHSPVTCQGRAGYQDTTYYTTPSGAGVFSSGTQWWICGLDPRCTKPGAAAPTVVHEISAITTRLLDVFGAGPAGRAHPARDNLAALHVPGAGPTFTPHLPPALVPG